MVEVEADEVQRRLVELKSEHRDLDEVIGRLAAEPSQDQLQLQRLKKRKLMIKDLISILERRLTPDIPA